MQPGGLRVGWKRKSSADGNTFYKYLGTDIDPTSGDTHAFVKEMPKNGTLVSMRKLGSGRKEREYLEQIDALLPVQQNGGGHPIKSTTETVDMGGGMSS